MSVRVTGRVLATPPGCLTIYGEYYDSITGRMNSVSEIVTEQQIPGNNVAQYLQTRLLAMVNADNAGASAVAGQNDIITV